MNPEQQRIEIAQACGWKRISSREVLFPTGGVYYRSGWLRGTEHIVELPNYLSDLNAMHEAEKYAAQELMDADKWEQYGRELEKIHPTACLKATGERDIDYGDFATLMTDLSATQRAEAFLRTLNLWDEPAKEPTTPIESS